MLTSLITLPIRAGLRGAELGLRASQALAERAIDLVGGVLSPTASPQSPAAARDSQRAPQARRPDAPPAPGRRDPRSAAAAPRETVAEQDEVASARAESEPRPPAPVEPPATPVEPPVAPPEPPAPPMKPPIAPPEPPSAPPRPPSAPPAPPTPPVPAPSTPAHIEVDETLVEEVADPGAEEGAGAQIHVAEPWEGYSQLKAADVIDQLAGRDSAQLAAVELYELSHRRRRTVIDAATRELRRAQNPPGS